MHVCFVIVAVLPVIAASLGSLAVAYQTGRRQVGGRLESVAALKHSSIQSWIGSLEEDLLSPWTSIAGGAAGLARQLGARVALVEKNRIGGDCNWTGCVPSKMLLKTARVAHEMRTADHHGLVAARPMVDLKAVMGHVKEIIGEIAREESPEALRAEGIAVWQGEGRFLDPHTFSAWAIP